MIWFASPSVEHTEKLGKDWTKLPGLNSLITTETSSGIIVNGVELMARNAAGRRPYGKMHATDVATICQGMFKLKFKVNVFHGLGIETRAQGGDMSKITQVAGTGSASDRSRNECRGKEMAADQHAYGECRLQDLSI